MKDLISVIVPIYNVEKYLFRCLETIINQTYKNIEIILINDGSKDNSINIINDFIKRDSRIKLINRENKGIMATRIEGCKLANGTYTTFVDSDDWVDETMIEVMYSKLKKYDADVVKCDFFYNDSEKRVNLIEIEKDLYINKNSFEPYLYNRLLEKMVLNNVWGQMFKTSLIKNNLDNFDTSISLGDDLELNLRLLKNIKNILFIPNSLYHYRYNPNSITRKFTEKNVKNNLISVTKVYYNTYLFINNLPTSIRDKYRKTVLEKLINEIVKWQIELIGILNDKDMVIKYLNWYYFDYELMIKIQREIREKKINVSKINYNIFYKNIYVNINRAYIIGKMIYNAKKIYRKITRRKNG